jgi:hypothetical protein
MLRSREMGSGFKTRIVPNSSANPQRNFIARGPTRWPSGSAMRDSILTVFGGSSHTAISAHPIASESLRTRRRRSPHAGSGVVAASNLLRNSLIALLPTDFPRQTVSSSGVGRRLFSKGSVSLVNGLPTACAKYPDDVSHVLRLPRRRLLPWPHVRRLCRGGARLRGLNV